MKKQQVRNTCIMIIFALIISLLPPASFASAKKTPSLSQKTISLPVKGSKKIAIKNARKITKLRFSLTSKAKKIVKVKKSGKKALRITGKKAGKTTLKISFRVNGKKYNRKLRITVKKKTPAVSTAPTPYTSQTPQPTTTVKPVITPAPDYHNMALKDLYSDSFMVGAAINGNTEATAAIHHEGMSNILKKHFNSTTLSNLMKPVFLLDEDSCKLLANTSDDEVTDVALHFNSCDPSLDFCQQNNIRMRGHVLIWHTQTPDWFFRKGYDDSQEYVSYDVMTKRMENYIKGVMEHFNTKYPGVVYCWDVVNECVSDGGSTDTSDGWDIRNYGNPWYDTMGVQYVYDAFTYARKYAAKDCRLIYNDYNVFEPAKCLNICTLVNKLKAKGLIDGIGLQPTILINYPSQIKGNSEDSFETCLRSYAKTGLELQVTELGIQGGDQSTEQAQRYQEIYELLLAMDTDNGGPCNITSVSVFGICDDYPLYDNFEQNIYLFKKDCTPKEAFQRILNVGINHYKSK